MYLNATAAGRVEYPMQHTGIQAVRGGVSLGATYEITLVCSFLIAVWGDSSSRCSSIWARGCSSVPL